MLRRRFLRPILVLGTTAAVAAAAAASASGGAAPAREASVGGAVFAPTLVAGDLVDGRGAPTSGTIRVYVMPPNLTAGSGARRDVLVAAAAADARGHFSVGADPAATELQQVLADAAENDGWVNFDLYAVADGKLYYEAFSRHLVAGQWLAGDEPTPAAGSPEMLVRMRAGRPGVTRLSASARKLAAANVGCTTSTWVVSETNAYTTYGEMHTAGDTSSWFRYGATSDSDIGVGVSSDGSNWSISGTAHVGNTRGSYEQWPIGSNYGHRLNSNFHYKKYATSYCGFSTQYSIKATQWNSGMQLGVDNSSYDHQCATTYAQYAATYYANAVFQRSSYSFVNFSAAASAFGVSLTAKSGASTEVIAHWNFGSGQSIHKLCGNDNFPTQSHRIFAGT